MIKKYALISLCIVILASVLGGCAKPPEQEVMETEPSNAKKIAMITSAGGLGDKGYNDASYSGLVKAKEELGVEFTVVEPAETSQGETYLRQFAQEKYGLVITLEYAHADAVKLVAAEFPEITFVVFNLVIDMPNVISVMFDIQDSSYLAGIIAGELTKPDTTVVDGRSMKDGNVIGFISATDSPGFMVFYEAFYQGAYSVNPEIQIVTDFTVGFSDTQKSKTVALNQIESQNADVIFVAAGLAALGVFQGVKEANVYAIGATNNMDAQEPGFIVTSALKRMDTSLFVLAKELKEGTLTKGTRVMTLAESGTDLTDFSVFEPFVTNKDKWSEIKTRVETAKADIISGKINVVDGSLGEKFVP